MSFKDFYLSEGRDRWDVFSIKQNGKKWTFKNETSGQYHFIKINQDKTYESLSRFISELGATPPARPKTRGEIDFKEFVGQIADNRLNRVYVKKGMFERIKKTWVIE